MEASYGKIDESSDLPTLEEFRFGKFSDSILEAAKQVLMVLEFTEFHWTINEVLEQDEQILDAVMYLKSIGSKIRKQAMEQEKNS